MDAIDGQPATAPMIAPGAASRRDHTAAILSSSTAHDSSGAPADRGGASRAADESEGGVLLRGGAHSLMYRTLRYVLLSNRLTLHELDGPQRLAVRSKIQFAVLQAAPVACAAYVTCAVTCLAYVPCAADVTDVTHVTSRCRRRTPSVRLPSGVVGRRLVPSLPSTARRSHRHAIVARHVEHVRIATP